MSQAKRVRADIGTDTSSPRAFGDHGYAAGGEIAQLQADLARRLSSDGLPRNLIDPSILPMERTVRFLSVAGGYTLLTTGYIAVATLVLRYV
ncbi:hypothetical protein [uncultured Sphingomonas sp.]|uniref:hypothetical protein n=1 Tax=uncultured Sphingomonas sp. TaxID=158754 RepID=UPI0035C953C6